MLVILTLALDGRAALKVLPFGHKDPPVPAATENEDPQTVQRGAYALQQSEDCAGWRL